MDTRLLYAMFDMLVDFVEVEKAWMNVVFTKRKPWSGWGRTHWWRSRNEGLAYLDWEIGLGDPNLLVEERNEQQAKDAQEIKYLYTWWKDVRPNRPDPAKVSVWDAVCDKLLPFLLFMFDRRCGKLRLFLFDGFYHIYKGQYNSSW